MTTSTEIWQRYSIARTESQTACDAYSAALKSVYKRHAGDMRYRPDLQPAHIRQLGLTFAALSNRAGIIFNEAIRLRHEEERPGP